MLTAEDIKKLLKNSAPKTIEEVKNEVRDEILDRLDMMEWCDFDSAYGIIEDVIDDFKKSLRRAYPKVTDGEVKALLGTRTGTIEKIVREEIKKRADAIP